jgi:pilus assembly protein CpaE
VNAWKPLIVSPSPETTRLLRAALAGAGVPDPHVLADYPPAGVFPQLAARTGATLCFVDLAPDAERALATIGEAAGRLIVIAVNPRDDANVILRALRRGAREFLSEASADQVRALVLRLDRTPVAAADQPMGRLLCVVPGKPGCGASTLAVHLALTARASGDARALLVDADPLTATIGFLLKLKSEYHIGDVVRDWKRLDDDLWSRLINSSAGVDVLLAPQNPCAECPMHPEIAASLAGFWRNRYDTVVVDTPNARAAVESGFAALADDLLLVSTNELSALHATRRAIEHLEQTVPDRTRLRLVLNRYTASTGLKREDVRTALQVEPFAILSNDYDLLQSAILEGKTAPPGSRFGAGVHTLSQRLRGHSVTEKKSGWLERFALRR